MRMACSKGLSEGYRVDYGNLRILLLQFAYDALFFCEPTMKNVLALKSMLRCFELASVLKVNSGSDLTSVPVLEKLQRKLASWQHKYLSFGGRICLLKSLLSSIPSFYLSFFKAPRKVINKIISLQRNFLWGAKAEERKKVCSHI